VLCISGQSKSGSFCWRLLLLLVLSDDDDDDTEKEIAQTCVRACVHTTSTFSVQESWSFSLGIVENVLEVKQSSRLANTHDSTTLPDMKMGRRAHASASLLLFLFLSLLKIVSSRKEHQCFLPPLPHSFLPSFSQSDSWVDLRTSCVLTFKTWSSKENENRAKNICCKVKWDLNEIKSIIFVDRWNPKLYSYGVTFTDIQWRHKTGKNLLK
jgi:hypothetical protein